MKRMFIILVLVSIFNIKNYSQGEGALVTATLQQSPLLLGAGQIGVSIPNDDVLGHYFNPAILGYSAKQNHASFSVMPQKTKWFKFGQGKPIFENWGLSFGYNLESTPLNLPISFGVGYVYNKFDFSKTLQPPPNELAINGEYESYDLYNTFSLGVGIDYFVRLNLGVSIRDFESKAGGYIVDEVFNQPEANGTMWDFGVLLNAPLGKYFLNGLNYKVNSHFFLQPTSDLNLGYSLTNYGDKIYYVDKSQKDPLSRTARLGFSLNIGFDAIISQKKINFMNYTFSSETQDILIDRDQNGSEYQSFLGDIDLIDHILEMNADENVIVHRGHIFSVFETLTVTSGSFFGSGYQDPRETRGLGLSSKGIFKLINLISENEIIDYITNHFVLDYHNADVQFWPGTDTNFKHLSLHFRGFEI